MSAVFSDLEEQGLEVVFLKICAICTECKFQFDEVLRVVFRDTIIFDTADFNSLREFQRDVRAVLDKAQDLIAHTHRTVLKEVLVFSILEVHVYEEIF